jgi:aspartyl-tRNA(Asn)/glutamyl-tRNA(Gln) amidotransferase subunit B
LLPLELTQDYVNALGRDLPELPDAKRARFIVDYGLSPYDADVLIAERERADYFELMVNEGAAPKPAANWLINEYLGRINRGAESEDVAPTSEVHPVKKARYIHPSTPNESRVTISIVAPSSNSAIVQMVSSGEISGKTAKEVLDYVWQNPNANPRKFVEERRLRQVTDMGAIETAVDQVIAANSDKAEQAKAKPALAGWFVGQVIKATGGKASPQAVNDLVKKKLGIA